MEENWTGLKYKGVDYGNLCEVSDCGNARDYKTKKMMTQYSGRTHYKVIILSIPSPRTFRYIKIHKAVKESFHGVDINKRIVNHIDSNKINNKLSNLEWCTSYENNHHSKETIDAGRLRGEAHQRAKLSKEQVLYIRKNYIPRHPIYGSRAMARFFNVAPSTVDSIRKGENWKCIK